MNEFRAVLSDQATHFITGEELRLTADHLIASIAALNEWKAEMRGKASQTAVIFSAILGISGVVLSIVALILNLLR